RLRKVLGLGDDAAAALPGLELHPLLNPAADVAAAGGDGVLSGEPGPAHEDGAWISLCGPGRESPLRAAVWGVSRHLDVEVDGTDDRWELRVVDRPDEAREPDEVAVTRFSKGSTFEFEPRRSLPIF